MWRKPRLPARASKNFHKPLIFIEIKSLCVSWAKCAEHGATRLCKAFTKPVHKVIHRNCGTPQKSRTNQALARQSREKRPDAQAQLAQKCPKSDLDRRRKFDLCTIFLMQRNKAPACRHVSVKPLPKRKMLDSQGLFLLLNLRAPQPAHAAMRPGAASAQVFNKVIHRNCR